MNKQYPVLLAVLFFLFTGCTDEDLLNEPNSLSATDGTLIGTVFLTWSEASGADNYQLFRLDPSTNEWVDVGLWGPSPYWDLGYGLSTNALVSGQEYQYKCRGHKDGPGFSEFSAIETGHSYEPQKVEITKVERDQEGNIRIDWVDPNDLSSVDNHLSTHYQIYRAREDDLGNFSHLTSTQNRFLNDYHVDEATTYYYKVAISYGFSMDANQGYVEYDDSEMAKEGSGGGGGNPVINYAESALGSISSTGGIPFVEMKMANGFPYLGTLEEYVTDGGKPRIYKLNGTSWQTEGGTLPTELTTDNFARMSFAAGTNSTFISAASYVFKSDGSTWSADLAADKMGEIEAPTVGSIEVLNDELYAAVYVEPDDDLKVYKWSGTDWFTVGGDASGWIDPGAQISEVTLQNIDGMLYLHYIVDATASSSTLKIKHLEGTSWVTDLEWAQEWLYNIHLVKTNTSVYFSSSSAAVGVYRGGVYQVTSTNSVEAIADENDDWFWTPYDLAVDSEENIILASQIFASQDELYPALSLFDGTEWKRISGDFSGGADPVAIGVSGTDIYFVRGDVSSENMQMDPTVLISSKHSK